MIKIISLLFLLVFTTSCTKSTTNQNNGIKNIENGIDSKVIENQVTEKILTYRCGDKDNVNEYLQKGWKVNKKEEQEVVCTWKTKKAFKNCDIDKDKGCKLTIPDKKGTSTTYIISR